MLPTCFVTAEMFRPQNVLKSCKFLSTSNSKTYDVAVVGGGIVGTATAREVITRHPKLKMAVLEKENRLAAHQSGHNSGVIHAGIYYKPGSLKAKLCVEGMNLAYKYLDEKKIPYKKCGKLIVAVYSSQLPTLADLYNRGIKNGVADLQHLKDPVAIKKVEPHCHGVEAIWSPHTGIVDWELVTNSYGNDFKDLKGEILLNFQVNQFEESLNSEYPIRIRASDGRSIECKYVLTCAGLQSDMVSEISGCSKYPRIVPFRGEYLLLKPEKASLVKGNIYPVPDSRFPFLGVHFTPRMNGEVWLGPNAVLALKREGYRCFDFDVKELWDTVSYKGFQKLALKYCLPGAQEALRSVLTRLQVKELQKFIPELRYADVTTGPSGVRAQALDPNGDLVDDFVFESPKGALGKRIVNCRNAPSPGATSSLAIAKMIADKADKEFGL